MITIVSVSIIALVLTILDSLRVLKGGMRWAFILITIIAMIRYDYGNDYMGYYDDYKLFVNVGMKSVLDYSDLFKDVGWSLFCIVFSIFGQYGFYILVALISLFTNIVYYKFITENVDRKYYWLSMFIYLFTFDMYVLQLSMIRQGLAIAILVLSYSYLRKGKILVPLVLCLIAISFHKTAIIFLPFIFLSKLKWEEYGKWISVLLLGLFIFLFASTTFVESIFGGIMALEMFSIYESSYGMEEGNQIGIRRCLEFIPFFVALYFLGLNRTKGNNNRYLVLLSTMSTLLFPFTTIIHMISRLCFYFSAFYVVSIPLTYSKICNSLIRYGLFGIFMGVTLYMYFDSFTHPVYVKAFSQYKTIFGVLF